MSDDCSKSNESGAASTAAPLSPAAIAKAERAKQISEEMFASIPSSNPAIIEGWKVKQLVISRPDQSFGFDPSTASSALPGGKQQIVGPGSSSSSSSAANSQAAKRLSRQATSKIHKFKPMVPLGQAIAWLSEYGLADSTIIFDNNCAMMFLRAKYSEFEDVRDEEEFDDE